MNTIMIDESLVTFKDIEKDIFNHACEFARDLTRQILEAYDRRLMEERDRETYRHKGRKQTTIKTVYGEVTYSRAIYQVTGSDGYKYMTYLLDEALDLGSVGHVSMNLVEMMTKGITELSYRECAKQVSDQTGQSISAMGVWNIVQALGETVIREEKASIRKKEKGHLTGKRKTEVLFEEADGVWLNLQGEDRKKHKKGQAEMRVAIAYDGWKDEGNGRYSLDGKVAVAGFSKAEYFNKCREAAIATVYDTRSIRHRILNGDGAQWVKNCAGEGTVVQLDVFHRNQAVRKLIHDKRAARDVMEYLCSEKYEEMFRYLSIYKDSVCDPVAERDAAQLMEYFRNNEEGLASYKKRIPDLPDSPEGIRYRNLGTMENHVWSIIARRMKHRHCSWSRDGANHLAKILAKKASGKLHEVTDKYRQFVLDGEKVREIELDYGVERYVSLREGKGYIYPQQASLPCLSGSVRGDGWKIWRMAGY